MPVEFFSRIRASKYEITTTLQLTIANAIYDHPNCNDPPFCDRAIETEP
jgi:hypothetical protein